MTKRLSHSAKMRKRKWFYQSPWKDPKIPIAIIMSVLMGVVCGLLGIWWTIYKDGLQ